ncbi:hypothetical protein EV207_11741 [Scopulibacillus darangshiensis]|uniref:DUF3726 domain-containing protein n=1 Tax=Scopulibacillus darangshiensis TaxID=442528 RepID=A0A4R2P1K3_9BACL|nr:hypothetical protein [Scopulibacillus darangshiensis]TCP27814.1 hypothetical protein EV207_11741 [Scopulibacillus darangshiensis]
MRVSFPETLDLCEKILEGRKLGGNTKDRAAACTWAEFCGLDGLSVLSSDLPTIEDEDLPNIKRCEDKECIVLNANHCSSVIYVTVMSDFAQIALKEKKTLFVKGRASHLLLHSLRLLGLKGKSCCMGYRMDKTLVIGVIRSGEAVPSIYKLSLNEGFCTAALDYLGIKNLEKPIFLKQIKKCDEFTDFIEPYSYEVIKAEFLKQQMENSLKNGKAINDDLWQRLKAYASVVLIESSDQSRLQGAGEGN